MLNPIEHTRTREDAMKYKSEPYVIAADVYSHPNLIGRGGWSWYTGSASWYFLAGVKYILGLEQKGEYLEINPHFPREWNDCYINYQIENTEYLISMQKLEVKSENEQKENSVVNKKIIYLDNELVDEKVPIVLDGKKHKIDVKF